MFSAEYSTNQFVLDCTANQLVFGHGFQSENGMNGEFTVMQNEQAHSQQETNHSLLKTAIDFHSPPNLA